LIVNGCNVVTDKIPPAEEKNKNTHGDDPDFPHEEDDEDDLSTPHHGTKVAVVEKSPDAQAILAECERQTSTWRTGRRPAEAEGLL